MCARTIHTDSTPHIKFDIPVGKNGDCWDRYQVRVQEIRESLRILEQALLAIQPGETMGKVAKYFRVPPGEGYGHLEAPRGDLGFYIVSGRIAQPVPFPYSRPVVY